MDKLPTTKRELDQMIQQGIETYMRNKQFNLSKIQAHEHNGTDTVQIIPPNIKGFSVFQGTPGGVANPTLLGGQIMVQQNSYLNYGTDGPSNATFSMQPIPVIYGGGNTEALTLTGVLTAGDTSATLDSNFLNPTGTYTIVTSFGELIDAHFTLNHTAVTWTTPLYYGGSTSIGLVGNTVFKGGECETGCMLVFSDLESLYPTLWIRVQRDGFSNKWWGVQLTEASYEYLP